MVRELGSKRRETGWSLSSIPNKHNIRILTLVREDWEGLAYGVKIILDTYSFKATLINDNNCVIIRSVLVLLCINLHCKQCFKSYHSCSTSNSM